MAWDVTVQKEKASCSQAIFSLFPNYRYNVTGHLKLLSSQWPPIMVDCVPSNCEPRHSPPPTPRCCLSSIPSLQ